VWTDNDAEWIIDLTGHHTGHVTYARNAGRYKLYPTVDNARTKRFSARADTIFENLGELKKLADFGFGGDAYPAEEGDRSEELDLDHNQFWHDEPTELPETKTYQFVYANGGLEISPEHEHKELLQHAGLSTSHSGPMAVGYVSVIKDRATWEVQSNVNIKSLNKAFKDYTKHVGWIWGGLTNIDGEPISDDFAPKRSRTLHWIYDRDADHLWIGRSPGAELSTRVASNYELGSLRSGALRVGSGRATLQGPAPQAAIRGLYDFCCDRGLRLFAVNDNALHQVEDLDTYDRGSNEGGAFEAEREPSGLYSCPSCGELFPNWHEYQKHRREAPHDEPEPDSGFPELDMDADFPPHFTEQQPVVMATTYKEACRVRGKIPHHGDQYFVAYHCGSPLGYAVVGPNGRIIQSFAERDYVKPFITSAVQRYTGNEPKDMLDQPIPFVFDIDRDKIEVGEPGQPTSSLGGFLPGGVVEGTYEPGGKLILRTETSFPYSVHHLVSLWYYSHPELAVKNVYKMNQDGKQVKLAAAEPQSVGGYISTMVAADPAAELAAKALQSAGGRVFAVGGAVRDAVMGNEPKDIDLMVIGLPAESVDEALRKLPGRVDLTGKDFGVFRFRDKNGAEVEIALPRKERSTGSSHQDFDVQADHTMTPEEDLFRRDFTANAMAVDLSNGHLIDPYGGVDDARQGILRTVNPQALSEDPLRVVRALGAHARHGLHPDKSTREQMNQNADSITHLPSERVQAELDKIFKSKNPASAIRLARETGVLKHILPEVDAAFGYDQQNRHHELELGDHLVKVLDRVSQLTDDPDVRLAALLHDIGKPGSQWTDPDTGESHFYKKKLPDGTFVGQNHDEVGARMAEQAMRRINGYDTNRINRVRDLVNHHMFPAFTTPKGARRFVNRVGDHADDLLLLREADQGGKSAAHDPTTNVEVQRNLLEQARQAPTTTAQLAVNGNDLIAAGIPQGPQIGQILKSLTQAVVDDPALNTRDQLLNYARQYGTITS